MTAKGRKVFPRGARGKKRQAQKTVIHAPFKRPYYLHLVGNQIHTIEKGAFQDLAGLERLGLKRCGRIGRRVASNATGRLGLLVHHRTQIRLSIDRKRGVVHITASLISFSHFCAEYSQSNRFLSYKRILTLRIGSLLPDSSLYWLLDSRLSSYRGPIFYSGVILLLHALSLYDAIFFSGDLSVLLLDVCSPKDDPALSL
ncbi:hypothetical protein AAG570_013233 [Ranatra chinensis]|uniref:Uncharacterized protein n=1 Tax=Ranatra chinensis TaxID=642074 RepID=A0ABD0YG78_9HEMI